MNTLSRDIRYGFRTLAKTPGFTAVAILTLALGIGANTAIFTLVNALLLQVLPVRNPTRLVELLHKFPDEPAFNGFSVKPTSFSGRRITSSRDSSLPRRNRSTSAKKRRSRAKCRAAMWMAAFSPFSACSPRLDA